MVCEWFTVVVKTSHLPKAMLVLVEEITLLKFTSTGKRKTDGMAEYCNRNAVLWTTFGCQIIYIKVVCEQFLSVSA